MTTKSPRTTPVKASPTKRFFVHMLTRDIALEDSILDLLDNCIDGVVRQLKIKTPSDNNLPYQGFQAQITISPTRFIIEDNCGGIPKDLAENYAFVLGRTDDQAARDADLPTVGLYGIGMKRAIFKMGESAKVISRTKENTYEVQITPEWLKSEEWKDLELVELLPSALPQCGTRIEINNLYPNISNRFNSENSTFIADLTRSISQLFAVIMQKGFKIILNEKEVTPEGVTLLAPSSPELFKADHKMAVPYLFQGKIKNVDIKLSVGFYRSLATEEEIEEETNFPKSSSKMAGWTIICNDRVVLYADKSMLTGWGTLGVPQYHTQFIAIAGVVTFTSNNSENLPLNTTKRGVDTSSEVYLHTLDQMKDGIKTFIDFTNKWKGRIQQSKEGFNGLSPTSIEQITKFKDTTDWSPSRRLNKAGHSGQFFRPSLPLPPQDEKEFTISFKKPKDEIDLVKDFLFEGLEDDPTPSQVGERCFNDVLKKAR